MATTSGEFNVHRLVQQLSGGNTTPPERLLVLRGLLSDSWRDDYAFLYQSPDLQYWLLIPKDLVRNIEQVEPTDQDPWGQDRLWISREGRLVVWIQFSRDDMPAGASQTDVQAAVDALLAEVLVSGAAEKFGMLFIVNFTDVAMATKSGCIGTNKLSGGCL